MKKPADRRKKKGRAPSKTRSPAPRWDQVSFTGRDYLREAVLFAVLDGMISLLFYRSWIAFILLSPLFILWIRERKKAVLQGRIRKCRGEFLTGVQLFSASLQAGYAAENAASEALRELEKIYEPGSFIVSEFGRICAGMQFNVPIEKLFVDMAARSGMDDIVSFAEVFACARRSGGDLIAISRNTVCVLRLKEETRSVIETSLSGKQMEQHMMSVIPLLILGYVTLASGGFLDSMYHTPFGVAVMSAALAVYGFAFWWGRQIMKIEV